VKIAAVREACGENIREQSPGVKPSAGRILMSVKEHFDALTDQCKQAIGLATARKLRAN
jgi:hypothetical protein